jgi:hypothetical protein
MYSQYNNTVTEKRKKKNRSDSKSKVGKISNSRMTFETVSTKSF